MTRSQPTALFIFLSLLSAAAPAARAQKQTGVQIGYVYPAGGQQGSTFEAVVAGQYLAGVSGFEFSGGGVQATLSEVIRPISGKELNDIRIRMDELMAKKAVVSKNMKLLENFRSFKNAKTSKTEAPTDDKEIQALQRKYANAKWTAEDDRQIMELRKKMSSGVRRPANPAISELAIVKVTVAPDAKPGRRALRIVTPIGLSNPVAFEVDTLPQFAEAASKSISEQKSQVAKTGFAPAARKDKETMLVTLPATVNGQILPGEVDRFRFQARKGQNLVVAAAARALIPYLADGVPGWFQATLALYDAQGKEVAYDDDFRFQPDPVLFYQIPMDGEYTVEIKDSIYRGREDFIYRVTVGELPFITSIFPLGGPAGAQTPVELKGWNLPATKVTEDDRERGPGLYTLSLPPEVPALNAVPFAVDALPEVLEQEGNNSPGAAQRVTLPVIVNGRIDEPGDTDVFRFEGRAGQEIVAEVNARRLNSPLDSELELTDAKGVRVAFNDDHDDKGAGLTTHQADSWLCAKLPADGTYHVRLSDSQHKGGAEYAYRLRLSAPQPDFALRVVPASVFARGGGTVSLTVYAVRRDGFTNEVALALKDAPAGFKLGGARVPMTQDQVKVTLTVAPTSKPEPVSLTLEGRATLDGKEMVRTAVPAEDMMQAFAYRHLVPVPDLRVAVGGQFSPASLMKIASETPVKIPAGGMVSVKFSAPGRQGAPPVHLELADPPDGITLTNTVRTVEGIAFVLQSDAAKVKPGQQGNLILAATLDSKYASAKSKAAAAKGFKASATLPAIPFVIVAAVPAAKQKTE